MPSGGHGRTGPPPDPNALRRSRPADVAGWTTLPAEGRQGPPPPWPLAEKPNPAEARVWAQFWRKPQAVVWERDQIFEPVAMFVRQYIEGMARNSSAENRKTVRIMFSDLYLTSDSLARARLRIAPAEVSGAAKAPAPVKSTGPSVRTRLKATRGASASS